MVWYKGFLYQAASWKTARRVVARKNRSGKDRPEAIECILSGWEQKWKSRLKCTLSTDREVKTEIPVSPERTAMRFSVRTLTRWPLSPCWRAGPGRFLITSYLSLDGLRCTKFIWARHSGQTLGAVSRDLPIEGDLLK